MRSAGVSVENNFTMGLVTEVTGVNSPENSVVETENIIYDRRGRAHPRPGLEYEFDYGKVDIPYEESDARVQYVWETSYSGSVLVMQVGRYLHFFSNSLNQSLSKSKQPWVVNLFDFRAPGASETEIATREASFSRGKDYLFVAHPLCDPFFIKLSSESNTISQTKITIEIRDFEGLPDGLEPDERPSTLSEAHKYNLLNQGWAGEVRYKQNHKIHTGNALSRASNPWPSNSDVPWVTTNKSDTTHPWTFNWSDRAETQMGNSLAPKGHFILKAFDLVRTGVRGKGAGAPTVGTVPGTSSGSSRPSSIAFYMGRVFYAGVDADGYRSSIYFSQVIERDEQIGQCYQQNDPTSEHAFDLLASDGGVIKILDIGRIVDIKALGSSLYVFANNGVWSISGTQSSPFSAKDYTVSKISSFGLTSKSSVVEVGETPMWWNLEGIYALGKDQTGFESQVVKVSEMTIQSLFDEIPIQNRDRAKGYFNDQSNLIYWLYSSRDTPDPYDFDKVLVLDAQSNAFYTFTLSTGRHKISGLFTIRGLDRSVEEEVVTDNELEDVLTVTGDLVEVSRDYGTVVSEKLFKFVTVDRDFHSWTFSDLADEDVYTDFPTRGGEDYDYYFITGYRIRGELLKSFQTNALVVITESDVNGSCYVQGVWDYRTESSTGRFTNPQQVYTYYPNTKYQRRKLRLRGSGYSLQFKFSGVPGKPFFVIGWAGFETGTSIP